MLGTGNRNRNLWRSQTLPRYRRERSWFRGYDISALSVWNSEGGVRKAGTSVGESGYWMIFAPHYGIHKGVTCRFVDPTGQPEEHVIAEVITHPHYTRGPTLCDIQLARLETPVSDRIRPMPILPVGLLDDMPLYKGVGPTRVMAGLPLFATDQQEHMLFLEGTYLEPGLSQAGSYLGGGSGNTYESTEFGFNTPWTLGETPLEVCEPRVSGDSGSPVMAIWNGCLNLCCVMTSGGAGTSIPHEFELLNSLGADLVWG